MILSLMKTLLTFALLITVNHPMETTPKSQHEIVVTISNLKNEKGKLMATLFNSAEGFPSTPSKAIQAQIIELKNNRNGVIRFKNLPPGNYAVSVFHDENNNDKLDTGTFGIPKEGYGFSNNPKIRFGPPSYTDTSFKVEKDKQEIEIKLNY
jgi:uncharacterized protein (DUF2141 family)